jgi:hypothetical protein
MKPWKEVLEQSVPQFLNIHSVIETLQARSQVFYGVEDGKPPPIFHAFHSVLKLKKINQDQHEDKGEGNEQPTPDPTLSFYGNVHCEAALATLVKYVNNADNVSSDPSTGLLTVQYSMH